jgi:hypothetical protein
VSLKSKRHMGKVQALGCILCIHLGRGETPAEVHHLFDAHQRSDWLVAPLCPECHRGPNGFHGLGGEPGFQTRYKLTEADLLAMTLERLS